MIRKLAAAASVGLLLFGQVATAASVQPAQLAGVQGTVMVNQNGRFVPVSSATALRAGDRVMAMDGKAVVNYGAGCNVAIAARSMTTVAATAPCAGGSSKVIKAAYAGGGAGQDGYGAPLPPAAFGWEFFTVIGFGVLTFGTVGYEIAQEDDDSPSSP